MNNGLFAFDTPVSIAYDSACLWPQALQGSGPARGLILSFQVGR
jgi:hypothetical protein